MKTELKRLPRSQAELTLRVPYSAFREAQKQGLAELSLKVKVDGFRPGHIPEEILRERLYPEAIDQAALDQLLPSVLSKAAQEHSLQIIAPPKIDLKSLPKQEGDELVFTATFEVMPEVALGDYDKIKVKKKEVQAEPAQVEETIQMVMDRFAQWKDADRAAQMGDRVEISFEGSDEAGQPLPNTRSKNHPLVLGSKAFVPGFEEELLGLKAGEEKTFTVAFPKDYHAKDMQGKKVTFKVAVGRIEERLPQLLDEEMVEKITGQKGSPEAFRKQVEDDLKAELDQQAQSECEEKIVQEIIKVTKVDLPETLIHQEVEEMLRQRKEQLAAQGVGWEQYLAYVKKTEEDFLREHRKAAEDRLTARFGVHHIVKQAQIQTEDEEVDLQIQARAARLEEGDRKKFLRHYEKGSDAYQALRSNLSADKLMKRFTA